jgi:hypothetical protein
MRRSVILLVTGALAVAALAFETGATSATSHKGKPGKQGKVTLCHRTGSASNPYVRITVASPAAMRGHLAHPGDIIPAPASGCPRTAQTGPGNEHPHVTTLTATLTGANEVPGPGALHGTGSAVIRLDATHSTLCFALKVANITLPAIGAHVHVGPAGVAGPIVVPLTPPDATGTSAGCVSIDPQLLAAIVANPSNYYVNVHTTDFPAGAIRGQLG